MTWHTATVSAEDLLWMTSTIRALGGTITGSRPEEDGVHVVWTTSEETAASA